MLLFLPVAARLFPVAPLQLADAFYAAGSLVFGGGHVVLPLLQTSVVQNGFVSDAAFVAGYGMVQAMPGPLFSLAAYLGAVAGIPDAIGGALLATLSLFAPAMLLIVGATPFWTQLRAVPDWRRALGGINAAVVGLLATALYDPVFVTAVHAPRDLALALLCWGLIGTARFPIGVLVPLAAIVGFLFLK